MNTDEHRSENELSQTVIAAAFEVSNQLGCGFLEKVYENAMVHELRLRGLKAQCQSPLSVTYKGEPVGEYYVDLLVEDQLIVELKCVERFAPEHTAQCLNYLRASGLTIALLINFQKPKVQIKRVIRD